MSLSSSLTSPRTTSFPGGLRELAPRYDTLLCDLWGVVHNGRQMFAAAIDALQKFRAGGGVVVFITNAPRPQGPVLDQIFDLGLPRDAFDDIVTSGDVTVKSIAARGTDPAYHIGPPRDLALFEAVEALTGVAPPVVGLEEAAYVVVTGLVDDAVEVPADYAARLAEMRRRGLLMICANPDIVVHVGDKLIYCGGALAQAYAAIGGETFLAGKPHAPIYEAAIERASRARHGVPIDRNRILAIGDALHTDVAGASAQQIDVLFVTSGIHREELHPGGDRDIDRLAFAQRLADADHRPLAAMPHLTW
ncbi:TIGR01459 family HAD-type hydrolase [Lichenihabitans sp. PAMC28606]|uniref:TIGR01459 family HAD-type hydrolase n=1 Tax=Lichenihabitans sp. PAMC28606 TaxID=2880932 RepID=UPI001D09BEA2|nr:TIGR01459 family HAD-type hydrolase [Lichenihabitans sp. PAMC28606]UDL94963.1 TIGR01459 family HAD-type hydrolase [Lichenihabitans sp. PAMC28606]